MKTLAQATARLFKAIRNWFKLKGPRANARPAPIRPPVFKTPFYY